MILVIGIVIFVSGLGRGGRHDRDERARPVTRSVSHLSPHWLLPKLASISHWVEFRRPTTCYSEDYPVPSPVTPTVTTTLCNGHSDPLGQDEACVGGQRRGVGARGHDEIWWPTIPSASRDTPSGEVLVFKPSTPLVKGAYPRSGRIYSMGWAPDRARATSSRLLKAEYVFLPYKPEHAILTGKKIDAPGQRRRGGGHRADSRSAPRCTRMGTWSWVRTR